MAAQLLLHGSPLSQPTRMAWWAARAVGLDVGFVKVDSGKGEHRTAAFLAKNPNARFPVLEEPGSGFVVYESNAIAQYVLTRAATEAGRQVAKQLMPDDAKIRAGVWQWMDWKHGALRSGCAGMVRRRVMQYTIKDKTQHSMFVDFKEIPEERHMREMLEALKIVEAQLASTKAFLVPGTSKPTLADVAVFEEIEQLMLMPSKVAPPEGGDLSGYPNIQQWLPKVRKGVPAYEEVHKDLLASAAALEKQRSAKAKM